MPLDNPNPDVELKALATDLKSATDEVKRFAERVTTEMKNLGLATEETKANADKALLEMNSISARLTEIEQKSVRRGPGGGPTEMKTLGQIVVEAANIKELMNRKNGQERVTVDLRDITSGPLTQGTGVSPTTSLVVPDRQPLVDLPRRQLVVRDLLTPGNTTSSNIEYPVETDSPMTTGAAVVSEGQVKPQSNLTFDLKSSPVRTIAHWVKASRNIMDDAPQLQSYIDGRLQYGLSFVEEVELLNGDGTGQHLLGLVPQATAFAAPYTASLPTDIDTLRVMCLQAALALYPATGYVLHPTDWSKIETTKDTQGRYIVGDPAATLTPRLWGLPVVATQAMAVGHALVGAFRLGAQIFDRLSVEVMVSTENDTDFVRNLITIRCEERLALAVYRPGAFIYGAIP